MSWSHEGKNMTVIRKVTDAITTVSVPFLRFGVIKFGGRATITRLQSGGLVVFSPTPLSDETRAAVNELGGQVSYLVAPDMEHHMNIDSWKKAFPSARVIAPQGLYEKRSSQKVDNIMFDFVFTPENKRTLQLPSDFSSEFDVEYFDGHGSREIVLHHKPSKAIIEADVLFNIPCNEQYSKTGESPTSGIFTQLAVQLGATLGKGQQRFAWYVLAKDRPSFNKSVVRVAGWDFDKIIPCHGDVVESGGNDVWRRLFAWNIAAAEGKKTD